MPLSTTVEQLEHQKAALTEVLNRFEEYVHTVDDRVTDDSQRKPFELTILHGKMIYEARIRWCDEAIRQLQSVSESTLEGSK